MRLTSDQEARIREQAYSTATEGNMTESERIKYLLEKLKDTSSQLLIHNTRLVTENAELRKQQEMFLSEHDENVRLHDENVELKSHVCDEIKYAPSVPYDPAQGETIVELDRQNDALRAENTQLKSRIEKFRDAIRYAQLNLSEHEHAMDILYTVMGNDSLFDDKLAGDAK